MIQRVLAVLLGLVFFVLAFVFVSVVLAVGLAVGVTLAAWLWWRGKGRVSVRTTQTTRTTGRVIDGEYREVKERTYHLKP
jgi:hypothetical protein